MPTKRLFKKKKERKYQFWTSVRKHREVRMAKKIQLITNLGIMRVFQRVFEVERTLVVSSVFNKLEYVQKKPP